VWACREEAALLLTERRQLVGKGKFQTKEYAHHDGKNARTPSSSTDFPARCFPDSARVSTRPVRTCSPTGPVLCAPGSLARRRLARVLRNHQERRLEVLAWARGGGRYKNGTGGRRREEEAGTSLHARRGASASLRSKKQDGEDRSIITTGRNSQVAHCRSKKQKARLPCRIRGPWWLVFPCSF
jgi:hypothetical protein